MMAVAAMPKPSVGVIATLERRIEDGAGDVLGVLRRAAFSDPAIAQVVAMGEGRRRGMVEDMITRLDAQGALRSGLTVADAVDVVEAMLGGLSRPRPAGPAPDRSPDDHERLLREQLRWLLLGRR